MIDRKQTGLNYFEISANSLFMLNEASWNQRQVIVGPLKCGNYVPIEED